MTNFERIKNMSKEELATELKLVANWNKKDKSIAEKCSKNFYLDWLNSEYVCNKGINKN